MANEENKSVETKTETTQDTETTQNENEVSENKENEVQETEQETNDVDIDNVDDEEIELDDSDTADEEETKVDNSTKKQSRAKNREYAQKRREQQEKEKKQSYYNGIKDTLGNVNPYTNKPIESDDDVQVYLTMKEMEKEGLDPNNSSDYIEFSRKREKTEREKLEKENQVKEKMNLEISEFKAKNPNVDIVELINNNKQWNAAILSQVQMGYTLSQAYDNVMSLINAKVDETARTIASKEIKKQTQNALASAGSQTNGNEPNMTENVNIMAMTDKEFKEYWKRKYGG